MEEEKKMTSGEEQHGGEHHHSSEHHHSGEHHRHHHSSLSDEEVSKRIRSKWKKRQMHSKALKRKRRAAFLFAVLSTLTILLMAYVVYIYTVN